MIGENSAAATALSLFDARWLSSLVPGLNSFIVGKHKPINIKDCGTAIGYASNEVLLDEQNFEASTR